MKLCHLLAALLLLGVNAFGQHAFKKITDELKNADPAANVDVIVQFKERPTDAHHRRVLANGGRMRNNFDQLFGASYSIPSSALQNLENDETVAHVSVDHPIHPKLDYATAAVNMQQVWSSLPYVTGSGIGVAIIDSGFGGSSQMNGLPPGHVVYNQVFLANGGTGSDGYGHGQHIAGIVASAGEACASCTHIFKGVAPGVNLINLQVLDSTGQGQESNVISAIQTAINLKTIYNIRVINLSLGRPVFESYKLDPLCQAVEAAWKAGIVVVVAAGNDGRDNAVGNQGYGTINSPGNDPYVITVGGMKPNGTYSRTDDTIASYSSKGPSLIDDIVKPDIVAPGNRIVSTYPHVTGTLGKNFPQNLVKYPYFDPSSPLDTSRYFSLSGTSMSAGVVSGAAALLIQVNPYLTPDQVKARLMKTAYKTFPAQSVSVDSVTGQSFLSHYDVFTVGAGYLDVAAALSDTTVYTGNALSPVAVFNYTKGTVVVQYDSSSVWSNSAAWGAKTASMSAAWGASLVGADGSLVGGSSASWGASAAWGTSGLFSTSTNSAQSSLWSESAAWGAKGASAESGAWGAAAETQSSSNSPVELVGEN